MGDGEYIVNGDSFAKIQSELGWKFDVQEGSQISTALGILSIWRCGWGGWGLINSVWENYIKLNSVLQIHIIKGENYG